MSGQPRGGSLEDGVRGGVDPDRTCLKYAVNGRDALLLGPPAASKSLPVTWRDHLPSPTGMSHASETDFGALLSIAVSRGQHTSILVGGSIKSKFVR